jgi:hypothetical protein
LALGENEADFRTNWLLNRLRNLPKLNARTMSSDGWFGFDCWWSRLSLLHQ